MNVSALCKTTGKTQKITITNNKGRLSKDDIENLVKDAERFKEEDNAIRKKIEAKNNLENYVYSVRNTLKDEKLKDKFAEDEKSTIEAKLTETTQWLEGNANAESVDFEAKLKALEDVFNPIMSKIY